MGWGIEMSDLVKQARIISSYGFVVDGVDITKLARDMGDRIEQLELELAEERGLCDRLAIEAGNVDYMERPHCLDRAITDHRIRRGGK